MVQELSVDVNEGRAPREARHVELRRVLEAADVECRGEGLDTVELAGLAVVDRVGGHKPGQEPGVTGLQLVEGRVAQPGPGAPAAVQPGGRCRSLCGNLQRESEQRCDGWSHCALFNR